MSVNWSQLIGHDTFNIYDRGYWGFRYSIRFIAPDKREYKIESEGEIRLRVLKKEYTPLYASPENPMYAWTWVDNGWTVRMTTSGRAYVGKK